MLLAHICVIITFLLKYRKIRKLLFWVEITLTKCKAKIHISALSKCMGNDLSLKYLQ